MKRFASTSPCPWLPPALRKLCLIAAGALCLEGMALAQAPATPTPEPPKPWWERAQQPLNPEIEKALAEVAAKITPPRKKDLADYMQEQVAAVVAACKITEDSRKKSLEEAATQAVEEAIKPFPQRVTETNRIRLGTTETTTALSLIEKWDLEAIAANRLVLSCTSVDEQPAWKDGLKKVLTPEEQAVWEKIAKEASEAKEKEIKDNLTDWAKTAKIRASATMDARLTAMTPVMKLDEGKVKRLKEAADKVIDSLCAEEVKRAEESLRFMVPARRKAFLQNNPVFRSYTLEADPEPHEAWKKAQAAIITPEELGTWTKHLADKKAEAEKHVPVIIKMSIDRMRMTWEKALESDLSRALAGINVPAERTKGLAEVRKGVLARTEKAWELYMAERIKDMTPDSRDQIVKNGRGYFLSLPTKDAPQNDAEWKKALEGLVTPEEKKQIEEANKQRRTRRESQVARMVLGELDRKIFFTSEQRERLLPIVAQLAGENAQLFPPSTSEYGTSFNTGMIVEISKKATDNELKTILDASQFKSWRDLPKQVSSSNRSNDNTAKAAPPIPGRKPEPEDVEGLIAKFLYDKSRAQQIKMLSVMVSAADDATRVAGLAPEPSARLRTAARGATEIIMTDWRSRAEEAVRSQIQGAVYQDVNQRMASIDDYYFNMYRNQKPEDQSTWKDALKRELNEEQYKKWQEQQKKRQDAYDDGVAAFVLAEFDRKVMLTPDQSKLLEPKVHQMVKDYSQDLQNYFSSSDGDPWYMEYYSLLVPMAGLEKELKEIILPGQWDRWTKSNEYGNCMTYWNNLKQMHEQRKKNQKN